MQSFHNDQTVKDKYINRVHLHRLADNLVQGIGWDKGRGCAVGCTLENYSHKQYPIELGLPEWLAFLEDHIFEFLAEEQAMLWPESFLSAIPIGIEERTFEILRDQFQIFWLERQKSQIDNEKYPQVTATINQTIALLEEAISGCEPNKEKWSAAKSAAESAAESAARSATRSAAKSAARSAAESAAWSATRSAAKSAARSATWSAAWSATWSAAWSEAIVKRDWLLANLATLANANT